MKGIICILFFCCLGFKVSAQVDTLKKPSTIIFHAFYNDFNTAQRIRTTSLNHVINNKLWSNFGEMQMGFGFSYLKGILRNIDFVSSLDGSATDYHFKDGTIYGSNKFLLDVNAGFNIKLLKDNHPVVPYIFAGAGFSLYQGKTGVFIPAGAGLQFNLFNQVFVLTNVQYRRAVGVNVNDHFQYSVGAGASIGKKRAAKIVALATVIAVTKPDTTPAIARITQKNIRVTATDQQTGLPLPGVDIVIGSTGATIHALSDSSGHAGFSMIAAADYNVSGTLNGISTSTTQIPKSSFSQTGDTIQIGITHNDPRFTLAGTVINKTTHLPESGVSVNVVNTTNGNSTDVPSDNKGDFSVQLQAVSDFSISGKKAGYISNIEKVSTIGLNRSLVIYVKLQLDIDDASAGKTITLSNIYYDSGSAQVKPAAKPDLDKLIKFLKDNPNVKIEIASYTDIRGSAKRNLILSQARAQGVVNYLQKAGIGAGRLIAKGYGATRPLNGTKTGVKPTDAELAQNRRTEFKVVAL